VLRSYPGEDQDPGAWEVTSANTHGGVFALRIHGNSWTIQDIAPVAIHDSTVWQAAVYVEDLGEIQAFGVGDGQNELLYTMAGSELPPAETWWTVYQGAFPTAEWYAYLCPSAGLLSPTATPRPSPSSSTSTMTTRIPAASLSSTRSSM
jgi:hypothetical protein